MSPGPCAKRSAQTREGFLRALLFLWVSCPGRGAARLRCSAEPRHENRIIKCLLRGFAQIRARLRTCTELPRSPHQNRLEQHAAAIVHSSARAISLILPAWTAPVANESAVITPRRLGSPASAAMKGWALVSPSALFLTSAGDSNNNPLGSKKSRYRVAPPRETSQGFLRGLRQRVSCLFGVFRRRRFHDNQNAFSGKSL